MNCIVTAGPTYEPLDDVRRLTNFSTGRLGTELANFLVARGHQVTLLLSVQATYAGERRAQRVEVFTTTANLREKLQALSAKNVNAVFHTAAVSDFRFGRIQLQVAARQADGDQIKKNSHRRRARCWWNSCRRKKSSPSCAPGFRRPGWWAGNLKRTANVRRRFARREQQLAQCLTDACVANGPAYGEGFGLITRGSHVHLADPPKLFDALEKLVLT